MAIPPEPPYTPVPRSPQALVEETITRVQLALAAGRGEVSRVTTDGRMFAFHEGERRVTVIQHDSGHHSLHFRRHPRVTYSAGYRATPSSSPVGFIRSDSAPAVHRLFETLRSAYEQQFAAPAAAAAAQGKQASRAASLGAIQDVVSGL